MAGHRQLPTAHHAALAAVLVVVALVAAACGGGSDGDATASGGASAGSGQTGGSTTDAPGDAPNGGGIGGVGFTRFDGGEGTFADHLGKPVVVNFFASWCAPCVREMPEIEKVHRELGDQVTFIGVDVRDRLAEGKELAARTGVTYELVRDPGGDVLTAFGGALLPTTAFVTADGRITRIQNHTYDADDLRATVHEELLR